MFRVTVGSACKDQAEGLAGWWARQPAGRRQSGREPKGSGRASPLLAPDGSAARHAGPAGEPSLVGRQLQRAELAEHRIVHLLGHLRQGRKKRKEESEATG